MINLDSDAHNHSTTARLGQALPSCLRRAALAMTAGLMLAGSNATVFAAGLDYLTLEKAKLAAEEARSNAVSAHHTIVIVVVDAGGFPIYEERADLVPSGMAEAALAKARTAALYGLSTKVMGDFITQGATPMLLLPHALPLEGGVPLFIAGRVVGAIGVAGSDSPSDGAAAKAGAARLTPDITDHP